MYAITNAKIYSNESLLTEHAVIIEKQRIQGIVKHNELDNKIPQIDLKGLNLCPGFIDLQLNGCGGVMFNGAENTNTLHTMHQANLKSGTTSFLPTYITGSNQAMFDAIQATKEYMGNYNWQVLGLHLEGPLINPVKKGIHRAEFIQTDNKALITTLCEHADTIKKVTLAPECVPAEVIKTLAEKGIIVSLGHSNASYQQASEAIRNGASFATHLFNAMSAMTGREPGLVGAVYDHKIYAGVIVDGFHVAFENIRISKQLLQEKLILVSDATAAASANIKSFDFVGSPITYHDGKCIGADGTLGGSAITLIESIQLCVEQVGIPLSEAIKMATLYPAKAIGVDKELGSIEVGKIANLAIFDKQFNIHGTVVNGHYQAKQS